MDTWILGGKILGGKILGGKILGGLASGKPLKLDFTTPDEKYGRR